MKLLAKHITFLIISTVSIYSHAQVDTTKKFEWYIGANAGVNASRLATTSSIFNSLDFRPGVGQALVIGKVQFGATALLYSEFNKGLRVELNYNQIGWTDDIDGTVYTNDLNYIDIPILSQIDLGKKATKVSLMFGPKIGFLQNETISFSGPALIGSYHGSGVDNGFDFGLVIGGGLTYKKSFGVVNIHARLSQSFSNIYSAETAPELDASQNQVITAGVTILKGL